MVTVETFCELLPRRHLGSFNELVVAAAALVVVVEGNCRQWIVLQQWSIGYKIRAIVLHKVVCRILSNLPLPPIWLVSNSIWSNILYHHDQQPPIPADKCDAIDKFSSVDSTCFSSFPLLAFEISYWIGLAVNFMSLNYNTIFSLLYGSATLYITCNIIIPTTTTTTRSVF